LRNTFKSKVVLRKSARILPLLAALLMSGHASAQDSGDQTSEQIVQTTIAAADRLLQDRDYEVLSGRLTNPGLLGRTYLDWLGAKFMSGESAFVAYFYAIYLQDVASQLPPEQAENIRGTALAALLYAIVVSDVDAQQCADRSARADRATKFAITLSQSGLLELADPVRESAALIALAFEERSWTLRQEIDDTGFLCQNGMAAITAGLAAGNYDEREPVPGEIGRQIGVTPPEDFVYERLDPEIWLPVAQARRENLPETIKALARVDRIPTPEEATVR